MFPVQLPADHSPIKRALPFWARRSGPPGPTAPSLPPAPQTLLRDPDKLRTLLATNPALAAIIAQSASSMGLNLPSMSR
jgi:hypothetical protein